MSSKKLIEVAEYAAIPSVWPALASYRTRFGLALSVYNSILSTRAALVPSRFQKLPGFRFGRDAADLGETLSRSEARS